MNSWRGGVDAFRDENEVLTWESSPTTDKVNDAMAVLAHDENVIMFPKTGARRTRRLAIPAQHENKQHISIKFDNLTTAYLSNGWHAQ
jgi:hypothetical protein